ncbi:lytic murein transglycosylase B [Desulfobulbus propionicus]
MQFLRSPLRFSLRMIRVFSHLAAFSALGLVACSDLSNTTSTIGPSGGSAGSQALRQSASGAGDALAGRPCVGSYAADRISGDFADYARLERFVDQMVREHGFDRRYLYGLFSQAKRKQWTLNYFAQSDKAIRRPAAPGSWTRYRGKFLDERHIGAGAEFARRYQSTLQRATRMYGVPGEYILGIMAVETNFGSNLGSHRVLDALTTLGFDYARRGDFFRDELRHFLLMAREEGFDPARPKGSFAGAMGLGQFMPSSFRKWAVDFNGDGHRDLWNPEDAIGSIANYFARHGWQSGQPVVEPLVAKGKGPIPLETGFSTRYPLASLMRAGLQSTRQVSATDHVSLLQLRYQRYDQYLIGYPNFYTITRYNHSTHYAMAVHELAQAIRHRL